MLSVALAVLIGVSSLIFLDISIRNRNISDMLMSLYLLASAAYIGTGGISDSLALLCLFSVIFAYMLFTTTLLGMLAGSVKIRLGLATLLIFILLSYIVYGSFHVAWGLAVIFLPYFISICLLFKKQMRYVFLIAPLCLLILPREVIVAIGLGLSVTIITVAFWKYVRNSNSRSEGENKKKKSPAESKRKAIHILFAVAFLAPFIGLSVPLELVKAPLGALLELLIGEGPLLKGLKVLVIILGAGFLPVVIFFEKVRLTTGVTIYPQSLLRGKEEGEVAAYAYSLVSMFLVALLFTENIFAVSAATALISDAVSALIGTRWGRHQIVEGRSVEGTIAGWLSAALIILLTTRSILAGLLIPTVVEIIDVVNSRLKVDDNLLFPIVIAVGLDILW